MSETTATCLLQQTDGLPSANLDGTFFGHAFALNLCSAQTQFPQFWNITVFLVRVMFIGALVFGVYNKLLMTLNNHDDRGMGMYG